MNDSITLKQIQNVFNEYNFMDIYHNFLKDNELTDEETIKLLSIAILLLNSDNENIKKCGYHILVKYSITNKNYELLDDLSRELLNAPILKVISDYNMANNGEFKESLDILLFESFKSKENDNYYTLDQLKMINDFFRNDSNYALIAPTSFGKSDLIYEYILKNYEEKNICVIVPTKALINQTRIKLYRQFKSIQNKP